MRTRSSLLRWLVDPEPPGLGLDLRADALSVARIAGKRGQPVLDLCATAPLPRGVLSFQAHEPNIMDKDGLAAAIESVLSRTGARGARRIALTLPDHLSRLSVVELPEAPRTSAETLELLKFRLSKSLPFEVEHVRLAYEKLPGAKASYLTGVMHEAVISQYEDCLAELGFEVGLIVPASVGLLRILGTVAGSYLAPGSDYFFVNVEQDYFTVSLMKGRESLALIRTLGLRASGAESAQYSEEDLIQEIIPTAIYYRERLGGESLQRVYYRSLRPDLTRLGELLEEQFEAPSQPFQLSDALGTAKDLQLDPTLAVAASAAAGAALGKVA